MLHPEPGIWKGEGWESHRFMFVFYCIFFWKWPPLLFHPSHLNGGKFCLPSGREKMTQELIASKHSFKVSNKIKMTGQK